MSFGPHRRPSRPRRPCSRCSRLKSTEINIIITQNQRRDRNLYAEIASRPLVTSCSYGVRVRKASFNGLSIKML